MWTIGTMIVSYSPFNAACCYLFSGVMSLTTVAFMASLIDNTILKKFSLEPGAYIAMNVTVALIIIFIGILLMIGIQHNELLVRRIVDYPMREEPRDRRRRTTKTAHPSSPIRSPNANKYKTATGQAIARVLAELRTVYFRFVSKTRVF